VQQDPVYPVDPVRKLRLGSNIGHDLFVGWVAHPDIFCWVSFLNPTYLPAIFVLSAQPNKMAECRNLIEHSNHRLNDRMPPYRGTKFA
jgi:hypothetical protein